MRNSFAFFLKLFQLVFAYGPTAKVSFFPGIIGKSLLLFVVIVYLLICVMMAVAQRSLLYYPHVYTPAAGGSNGRKGGIWNAGRIRAARTSASNAFAEATGAGSVLITYGNGSTATGCADYADDIQNAAAMDVYILEYPGYEDRPGKPSEKNLFAAADDALRNASRPTSRSISLANRSVPVWLPIWPGTYTNRIAGIVLISPFNSVVSVGQHRYPFLPVCLLAVDRFPSEKYLRNYHGKVGITRGWPGHGRAGKIRAATLQRL